MKSTHIIKNPHSHLLATLILAILFLNSQANTCTIECIVTNDMCTLCFQNCQGTYSYGNCSQQLLSPNSGSNTSAGANTVIYDQTQCSQKCCNQQLSPYGLQKFTECEAEDQRQIIKMIILIVIPLIVVMVVCICCCSDTLREKISKCLCKQSFDRSKSRVNHQSNISVQIVEKPSRSKISDPEGKIEKQMCGRCKTSVCNVVTACGHAFDMVCLWKEVNLGGTCPSCKSIDFQPVSLYCLRCQNYLERRLNFRQLFQKDIIDLKEQRCENCSE